MRHLLSALIVCALISAANADIKPFRIVASDIEMPTGSTPIPSPLGSGDGSGPAPAPDYINGDVNGNPVLNSHGAGGSQTLNLWVEVQGDEFWHGVSFDIYATGDLYAQVNIDEFAPQWQLRSQTGEFRVLPGDEQAYRRFHRLSVLQGDSLGNRMIAESFPGLSGDYGNGIGWDGDPGVGATSYYDTYEEQYVLGQRGTWFRLGSITVTGNSGEVYLGYRPSTYNGGEKGEGIMYYGWNSSGILNIDENL
ncbi:MAG: hypothetical protein JXO22_04275, partial [Phycisphaerae bacterium]|nr:hypothetical protein [Phycisphaerae bacterium]